MDARTCIRDRPFPRPPDTRQHSCAAHGHEHLNEHVSVCVCGRHTQLWNKIEEANTDDSWRGWVMRRGFPALAAFLFCWVRPTARLTLPAP